MLNLHWALERGLLDDSLSVSLVAYASDPDLDGQLHLDSCWALADQATADEQAGGPATPGRVMLDLDWAHVQGLVDAEAHATRRGMLCSCLTDPSAPMPGDIQLAHYLGALATLLATDPADDPEHPTRVLLAVADVLALPHGRVANQPLLEALDQLLAEAAPRVAQVDPRLRPAPQRHPAQVRYLTAAASTDAGFVPAAARDAATVTSAEPATVAGWWAQVVAASSWREAAHLSIFSARAVTGAWVDLAARRLLVRVPDAATRGMLLSRQPVLSTDPDADPSTL